MRGQVEMATRAGDRTEQRAASMAFARWLAARDRSLDDAALMAATALELGEDAELRRELAAWLESLGEPEAAARALEELARSDALETTEASYVMMRVGVLYARAGLASEAAAAFSGASAIDQTDALSGELLATIASWAPGVVSPAKAAEAYVESSRRRARGGSPEAELEDLWRAYATDRASKAAADALAAALAARGRRGAADEVLRAHAQALGSPDGEPASHGGLAIAARIEGHTLRRQEALEQGDIPRALGAALDEGLDMDSAAESAEAFDGLLLRAGMLESVAARLEARADQAEGRERARRYEQLARLFAGPLADPARAASAHKLALTADPACEEAILALENVAAPEPSSLDPAAVASRAWVRATGSDGAARAMSLAELAVTCEPPVRAVLLAVAAERLARAGDRTEARRLAEQACQTDPANARCVATLADIVAGSIDRMAAAAVERAINLVGPRTEWCATLASALEALGENDYAVAWTQRFVALQPGDRRALETMLSRVLRAGDRQRLGDALAWLLSQPHPFEGLAPLFCSALRELGELDPERAAIIARRALDVFGPKDRALRDAMLKIADGTRDDAFVAAVLERWLATGPEAADLSVLYAQLADRRDRLGDTDGEARVLARAVREVGTFPGLRERMASLLGQGVTADGELALMEARAELLATQDDRRATSSAWRDLGAALWDLAGDRHRAVRAWMRAAKMAPSRGYPALGVDLIHFAGPPYAFECLSRVAEETHDEVEAGSLFGEAARAALAAGDPAAALEFAKRALAHNPAYADALEMAERAGVQAGRAEEVSPLYDIVAGRALGRFGQRAAHYRGARFFEQRGESALALRHAALAFTAVPSEGASLLLLERTAQSAGDRADAVRAIELVAERASSNAARAAWLLRAASLAGGGEDGARRRLDALLRAALVAPNLGTLAMLSDAVHDLVRVAPEERAGVELRLSRASRALVERFDGPEGARMAIALAEMLLALFEDGAGALAMLERALAADADIDEFTRLMPLSGALAAEGAAEFVARALDAAEKPMANVGVPALRLLGAIANAVGDARSRGRAAVLAAERDTTDESLVMEADAAVKALGDSSLEERLSKRVAPATRVRALRAAAELRLADGRTADAVAALERAVELSTGAERLDAERALRQAYDAAGRGSEVDERAQREASSGEITPRVRAERWTELADRREQRKDFPGALRALVEASRLDPEPVERWGALERVAELAGDDDARIGALDELAKRVRDDGKLAVLRRLARAYEGRRDYDAAEQVYRRMLDIDPNNEDFDQAIEGIFAARGEYERLAAHLEERAERLSGRSGQRESLRALRLRRAVILEQRLGRVPDACEELTRLLAETPDSPSALRYLADLRERLGEASRAAPLWRRAAALEVDPNVRNELELRAARASKSCGDLAIALVHVRDVLSRNPTNVEGLELRVELARAAHDDVELGWALEAFATVADIRAQGQLLVEAAHASIRAGDLAKAVGWAQRAALLAPDNAEAQLTARSLEYRLRGAGAPDDARRTIEELGGSAAAGLSPSDTVLRSFLMAEALDVVQGGAAGLKELTALEAEHGEDGLLALGLAERLARTGRDPSALPYFELAMRGDLRGLRKASSVTLAAAEAATRAGQLDAAATFLESAAADAEARLPALVRLAQLAAAQRWFDRLRAMLPDLGNALSGDERARTLAMAGRVLFSSRESSHHEQAEAAFAAALEPLAPGSPLRAEIEGALEAARENRTVSSLPPDVPRKLELVPSDPPAAGAQPPAEATPEPASPEPASPPPPAQGPRSAPSEPALTSAFAEGSMEAGDALAQLLEGAPDRSGDLVRLRRQQVERMPGNLDRLARLQEACLRDDDRVYARAVEHVMRAFDPRTAPLVPPPLSAQLVEDGMLAVLTRPSHHPVAEALALVWEGAAKLFLRDPASYGITGLERVVPGTSSVLARLYQVTIRVLDVPRIPLFVPRGGGPLAASVALLQPPSVIISGENREETSALRFVLGRGLSAALPQNVLLLGLPDRQAQITTAALLGAFGPPELGRSMDPATARVAESFWQLLPPRTQRRLQELLVRNPSADIGVLTERAHQSGRRVGLFLSGDFSTAGGALLAERDVTLDTARAPGGLEHLCARIPELADLLLLAVSPEYAAGRWHAAAPPSSRSMGSGRFTIV